VFVLETSGSQSVFSSPQRAVVTAVLGFLAALACAALGLALWRETGGTNSYALLAEAFLNGRLYVERCFDLDCALFEGQTYVIFPPLPAVILMPFVAIAGPNAPVFMPLSLLALAGCGLIWWRMAASEGLARDGKVLAVLLVLLATPLFYVALRGSHIWFFAQVWAFLFCSLALYSAAVRRNAWEAGLFIALAFLCRQMAILLVPFVYVLLLDKGDRLFWINGQILKRASALLAFPLIALAVYFAYNFVRFGSVFDTGYAFIFPPEFGEGPPVSDFIRNRVRENGLFSLDYALFNSIYMFLAGPHVEFSGRYMTQMTGFDMAGASPFLVTPVLLMAFLARWTRAFFWGLVSCAVILGITLLYHSNGFSQYSAQRYALDWLPVMLLFVLRGWRPEFTPLLAPLIGYSIAVTVAMTAIGGLLAG
jgi:hypothetical protein